MSSVQFAFCFFPQNNKGKAKYPCIGTTAPTIPHCAPAQLLRGGNKWMMWWDCSGCLERITDMKVLGEDNAPRYYSVPPCRLSPNYDPLVPKIPKSQTMTSAPPPLSAAEQARQVKEPVKYSIEQEQILAAARAILLESGVSVPGTPLTPLSRAVPGAPPPFIPGVASSSYASPAAPSPASPKRNIRPAKRNFMTHDHDPMAVEIPVPEGNDHEAYEVLQTDEDILKQLAALEEITSRLKGTLKNPR